MSHPLLVQVLFYGGCTLAFGGLAIFVINVCMGIKNNRAGCVPDVPWEPFAVNENDRRAMRWFFSGTRIFLLLGIAVGLIMIIAACDIDRPLVMKLQTFKHY